jgi:hypothetical protein
MIINVVTATFNVVDLRTSGISFIINEYTSSVLRADSKSVGYTKKSGNPWEPGDSQQR